MHQNHNKLRQFIDRHRQSVFLPANVDFSVTSLKLDQTIFMGKDHQERKLKTVIFKIRWEELLKLDSDESLALIRGTSLAFDLEQNRIRFLLTTRHTSSGVPEDVALDTVNLLHVKAYYKYFESKRQQRPSRNLTDPKQRSRDEPIVIKTDGIIRVKNIGCLLHDFDS